MKDSFVSKSSGWAMRPLKHWRTKRLPMANRGKRFRLWSVSQEQERCLAGKRISFGPGLLTYTRACCFFTKDGILKLGGSALRRLLFLISRRSPGRQYSHTYCSRESLSRWGTPRRRKGKRTNLSRGSKAFRLLSLSIKLTCLKVRSLKLATTLLRLTLPIWRPRKRLKPCAAGYEAKNSKSLLSKTECRSMKLSWICTLLVMEQ